MSGGRSPETSEKPELSRVQLPENLNVTRHYAAARTTQVLLPPKPKELDTATFTGCSLASWGTWQRLQSGSGWSRLMVGGTAWRSRVTMQASASRAAAAVSRWPLMLLVELTGMRRMASPKTVSRTRASALSPTGVLVAWALM